MKYLTSKQFDKNFSKLSKKVKEKVITQFTIFLNDPVDFRLNNHSLNGKWRHYRSINITADIRAVYKLEDGQIARFIDIGSHSVLYK
jgi:addiction module RelE/StbE family toxin